MSGKAFAVKPATERKSRWADNQGQETDKGICGKQCKRDIETTVHETTAQS